MAAGTVSWNGLTISRAVQLTERNIERGQVIFDYPDVDGVEVTTMGFRGLILGYLGQIPAADMAALDTAIAAWEAKKKNGVATLTEAGTYVFCQLLDFRVLKMRPGTGGRVAVVAAVFQQLRQS